MRFLLALLLSGHLVMAETTEKVWIFFNPRPESSLLKNNADHAMSHLDIHPDAITRRQKVMSGPVIDIRDWPVNENGVAALRNMGVEIVTRSRWLNAVSAWLSPEEMARVNVLPEVKSLRRVVMMHAPPEQTRETGVSRSVHSTSAVYDYGDSELQNAMIHVPEVHALGLDATGVKIGVIDAGFDWRGRTAFQHLDVIDEYDFVWDDDNTTNQGNEPPDEDDHGAQVLSVVGGFHGGELIGPAFRAQYALAKTEWTSSETRIEEDWWVAGLEWLERLGMDIVTSSVSYSVFDEWSYDYADLDGNTAVTTLAADIAVSKGVVVLNTAGNERSAPWHYVTPPGDGFGVITVGAVTPLETLTYFSSVGPTADGRIKPDVVAMGMNVVMVTGNSSSKRPYTTGNGTSYSTPLVAGVCGLVLEAHPELGPHQVREAIRETADRAASPDTLYGWGLVNAWEAIFYHGMVFTHFNTYTRASDAQPMLEMDVFYKHGVNPESVVLHYRGAEDSDFRVTAMTPSDEPHRFEAPLSDSGPLDDLAIYITATDSLGQSHTAPINAPEQLYSVRQNVQSDTSLTRRLTLYQNYPNPFVPAISPKTTMHFRVGKANRVKLEIFNIRGRRVKTICANDYDAGEYIAYWDGRNQQGNDVASGVYLARLSSKRAKDVIRIVLLR